MARKARKNRHDFGEIDPSKVIPDKQNGGNPKGQLPPNFEHLKKHQWKKGQSGYPAGRPKGVVTLSSLLKARLAEEDIKIGKAIVDRLVRNALHGDDPDSIQAIRAIFDRHDGPVKQVIEHEGEVDIKYIVLHDSTKNATELPEDEPEAEPTPE